MSGAPSGPGTWRSSTLTAPPTVRSTGSAPGMPSALCCRISGRVSAERGGIAWRTAYVCASQAGTLAPTLAGLAVTVGMAGPLPAGLRPLGAEEGLPGLPEFTIELLSGPERTPVSEALAEHIEESFRREAALEGAARS